MKKMLIAVAGFAALLVVFSAGQADAATVSVSGGILRETDAAEQGDGAPEAFVHNFFVTTDGDILRIGDVNIDIPLYNNALGSDTEAPNPAFVAVFPALGVDSYITTPGSTAIAGDSLSPFNTNSSFFDSDDNGAQNDFLFAQLTTDVALIGNFNFVVSVAGATGPEVFPFSLALGIPEPASFVLAGIGLIGLVGSRRR